MTKRNTIIMIPSRSIQDFVELQNLQLLKFLHFSSGSVIIKWLISLDNTCMYFLWKCIVSNRKRNIFLENPIWEQIWIRLWGHLGTDVLEVQPNNHKKLETSSKTTQDFFNFKFQFFDRIVRKAHILEYKGPSTFW